MSIIVGSARNDENGRLSGGSAGDQTGKEVMMQDYYLHKKGWYLIRPKDAGVAEKIASAMKAACENNHIGYDQGNRLGVINKLKVYGKLGKIAENTECDCSSLVRACCIEAGIKDPGNFTTASEVSMLSKTGQFEKATDIGNVSQICTGDILVTKTKGHTVIVVSGHKRNATSNSTGKTYVVKKGDTLSKIALNELGKASRYTEIQKINGLKTDRIYVGQKLILP